MSRLIVSAAALILLASFDPSVPDRGEGNGACAGSIEPFYGYSFLDPGIINKSAAYAPFFARWDDYYERFYFGKQEEIQMSENIEEWRERFCGQPLAEDVARVVYGASAEDIMALERATADSTRKTLLPGQLAGNTFAEMISYNGCLEVTTYLIFAKRCEPYVSSRGGWEARERYTDEMLDLIKQGKEQFHGAGSHFIRMRYLYQLVRLAHYAGQYSLAVKLYDDLFPKIQRKKASIIHFWVLGHVAGAQQKLGRYPEAAYLYSLVFRHSPSKRAQAYRSFLIRNDADWDKALRLCQTDAEKSTLYVLRAGGSRAHLLEDMMQVYDLDPGNPQLDLMLVSEVQEIERVFLRTAVTDQMRGKAVGRISQDDGVKRLLNLQKFVRQVTREKKYPNLKLWRGIEGYLELMAGDRYAAEKRWDRLEDDLDDDEPDEEALLKQLKIWRCLLEIMNFDPKASGADAQFYAIMEYEAFKLNPAFEPFLRQWVSAAYADAGHPGKAVLVAWPPNSIALNPRVEVYDDLLSLSEASNPILLVKTMQIDTNPDRVKAYLLELKGAYFLSQGKPEAAVAIMRSISQVEAAKMPRFTPFREKVGEKVHRVVSDSLLLNRLEIAEKILDLEFRAKTAEALGDSMAATWWYRIGVAYYNMSYFGYEWEVTDAYRSGYNQLRLAQGPVFSLAGSPEGNRENTDMSVPLSYFEKALAASQKNPEIGARAAFMAARCRQKQWFCDPACAYRPGTGMIPDLPEDYFRHYSLLINDYSGTKFYNAIVKECKWLAAYAR